MIPRPTRLQLARQFVSIVYKLLNSRGQFCEYSSPEAPGAEVVGLFERWYSLMKFKVVVVVAFKKQFITSLSVAIHTHTQKFTHKHTRNNIGARRYRTGY